jgi:hypothetical protein
MPLSDFGEKWIARTCPEGISPHEMFDVVLRPGRSSFMPVTNERWTGARPRWISLSVVTEPSRIDAVLSGLTSSARSMTRS